MKEDLYIHSIQFIVLLLRIINSLFSLSFFPHNAAIPNLIDISEGRSICIFSIFNIIYFQLLLIRNHKMHHTLIQSIVMKEDLHSLNRSLL